MWHARLKRMLITITLIAVGTWLLVTGWAAVDSNRRLDMGAVTVEGRVIDTATEKLSKGGQSSTVTVEYLPGKPPAITRKIDVSGSDYRAALETGKVQVSYLPDDPEVSRVTRFAIFPFQFLAGLGGLILFSGLFCLGYFIVKRV
jgi:Protein of unknown function (DUF3592)